MYIQLKLKRVTDGGDHDVAICEVVGTGMWDDNDNAIKWLKESDNATQALDSTAVLYTGQLRDEGII
jgi:flavin reductase (DIM6/NTAB) family NADH-FMN oxidoreductase RutF